MDPPPQQQQPQAPEAAKQTDQQRQEWAAGMRRLFSPASMLNEDGSINQDYFKPRRGGAQGSSSSSSGNVVLPAGKQPALQAPQQQQGAEG